MWIVIICKISVDQKHEVVKIVAIVRASPWDYIAQRRDLEKKLSGTTF